MNKYTELSDFEINLLVAQFVLPETQYDVIKQTMDIIQFLVDGSFGYRFFDPCNNPTDAMPIIIENGISMVRVNNTWSARQFNNHCIEINGDNYYRIAMICFLLMKDAENEG
ncbi:TPA: DUF2591 domain-containing protein [Proteus mirabilis]|nr:DUF2591 domain-containing protein [Proteus mirabilis]HEK1958957.1 DUF2591 domain-containing protein [Proteus mirabilis]HEK2984414.1 DUF2591 domain-containing protein [Proteus mirabilis]HEK3024302.1 DUF2591 domain-containing protein [Proteus mirabilis]HEK3179763.1 DUF2591 domain-containing protein [Proteus mirabilis]